MSLPYAAIREALDRQTLFEDKSWRLSPEPWPLTPKQLETLEKIGRACLEFYRAVEQLYLRSSQGRNLLRNREFLAPWASAYLDRGKPEALIAHARSKRLRGAIPPVIRPDLLLTDDGFALTEMDSVPGGIGLTAFINRLYAETGGEQAAVVGREDRMIQAFYRSLIDFFPNRPHPVVAILVSDEASTYRPEMEWLARELRAIGKRVYCLHPRDVMPLGNTLCHNLHGNPEQIDIVYRFWELFDLANVPVADWILKAWEDSELVVAPPMRHFHEEKLNMALFHHHLLEDFWREHLSGESFDLLRAIVPRTWIMDPVDLPPNAVLDAPPVGGKPIWMWDQLGEASQKERGYVIKLSGFHENAWGARSVVLGTDVARTEWMSAIRQACRMAPRNLSLLQEYRKPKRLTHPIYGTPGNHRGHPPVVPMEGRLRLCPYYFVNGGQAELSGVLATFCPADKKIIHGMKDAALLPCCVKSE